MKVRTGFVSNSSTSSFICDVCGTVEAGMDMRLTDFEMSQCSAGHIYCDHHVVEAEGLCCCPICSMQNVTMKSLLDYVLKYYVGQSRADVEAQIKEKFDNYDDFMLYIKAKETSDTKK